MSDLALTGLTPPQAMESAYFDELAIACNHLEKRGEQGWLPEGLVPVGDRRAMLQNRHDELQIALTPIGAKAVIDEVAALMKVMVRKEDDARETAVILKLFAGDLAGLPRFAFKAACEHYRSGQLGKWFPKPVELRRRAERLAAPFTRERTRLKAVLEAKPLPQRRVLSQQQRRDIVRHALARPSGERVEASTI